MNAQDKSDVSVTFVVKLTTLFGSAYVVHHKIGSLVLYCSLTLSLLMSFIYGAPCKARKFNVVYIWTNVWQR
jgi:hypothetical protein